MGTGKPTDRSPLIDTPQLTNVASPRRICTTAPRAPGRNLDGIQSQDKHGVTNDLTKDELNDLIEYLRTL